MQQALRSFRACTEGEEELYSLVVIDDSAQPFAQRVQTLCEEVGAVYEGAFCDRQQVFYAGVWEFMLDSCQSPYLLFLPDDTWSILQQSYLKPGLLAMERHADLYEVLFQCPFSAWTKAEGSPVYRAQRWYDVLPECVETVQGTRLYPHPLDDENTLWMTASNDVHRGAAECLSLNHTLHRTAFLRAARFPSPRRLSRKHSGLRLWRRYYEARGSVLLTSPGQIEQYFLDQGVPTHRWNAGYLNMQTFSYTPDHQPCGIDELPAFLEVNSTRLLALTSSP